jgi:hypothetical protein
VKTYIGTKMIDATPMTRAEYNEYRGWELPANEDGADEGYLVEYHDGGKGNDSRHAGYISWSPKEQFEKAYLPIGDISGMPVHQQRVVAEKAQLDDKLNKLIAFYSTAMFEGLPTEERTRLRNQGGAMRVYSEILGARIDAFGESV